MKKKTIRNLGILIIILIFAGLIIYNNSEKEIIQLPAGEIREYQGARLDSVTSFRENSIKGVQYIDLEDYQLKIYGLVENAKNYTYDEVLDYQSYSKVITLHCVEGWSAKILWEGIFINELFDDVKPLPEANTVIFYAFDGYSVAYPIEYFEKDVILAYKMNNATIIPERGFPFVLVAEDKWGYKWIKWIIDIEFSDDTEYLGFWESRGYSKEGNLNESSRG